MQEVHGWWTDQRPNYSYWAKRRSPSIIDPLMSLPEERIHDGRGEHGKVRLLGRGEHGKIRLLGRVVHAWILRWTGWILVGRPVNFTRRKEGILVVYLTMLNL